MVIYPAFCSKFKGLILALVLNSKGQTSQVPLLLPFPFPFPFHLYQFQFITNVLIIVCSYGERNDESAGGAPN